MMEDRKLSEKESLELISRMIQETQESKARYEAYPLLIWGYTTIVISCDFALHLVWDDQLGMFLADQLFMVCFAGDQYSSLSVF